MITVIYFWRIRQSYLPIALIHMAIDRFALGKDRSVNFFKSLGTGKGETFTPKDADVSRWGLLVTLNQGDLASFHNSKVINSWRKIAISEYRAVLKPISSHGQWAGIEPFSQDQEKSWQGPVAAITRARIKFRLNSKFWSAVPPVTSSLKNSPGLQSAIGIGEAPIGLQGTFSRWESASSLRDFAYAGSEHKKAIEMTKTLGWYSEELFARFAIIDEQGEF
jgi:hypothetical protein